MRELKISNLFVRDGKYKFSRWNKSIAPVVFGVDDTSLVSIRVAFSNVISLTSLPLSDFDPELGSNFLVFFCTKWNELNGIPNLNKLIPDLLNLLITLDENGANQYRTFLFTPAGAINLSVLLLKYDNDLSSVSVQTLATSQMLQSILLWSPDAFKDESPIALLKANNMCVIKPFYAALIKAAYDQVLPDYSEDSTHALRLSSRVNLLLNANE